MKRLLFGLMACSLVILFISDTAKADAFEAEGLYPAACIVTNRDFSTFREVRDLLKQKGVRGLHSFPPHVIYGRFPLDFTASDLPGMPVEIVRSPFELPFGRLDPVVSGIVRDLFNEREFLARSTIPPGAGQLNDLVLEVPDEIVSATTVRGRQRLGSPMEITARNVNQNTEFMLGDILVNIIFPESDGIGSENWTDEEMSAALTGIVIGISQYQQKALWVDLNFEYNYEDYMQVPVSREPIEGDWGVDYLWMHEALTTLGYDGEDVLLQAHNFNSDNRIRLGTDWVFTAFVVDASNSPNNCWGTTPGYVAYSYLGGPLLLVPFPACRFGTEIGFSHVFIHEMSHSFWALDEYASAKSSCKDRAGYLAIENMNTYYQPCQQNVPCIMNNAPLEEPLPICEYTMGQVGIADENWNSIPDIYEVYPSIEFLSFPGMSDTILEDDYILSGTAWCNAVPNINPRQDPAWRINYAPALAKGVYEINGSGFAIEFGPSDGQWNSSREHIGMFLSGFEPGRNTLTLTVENCIGLATSADKHIYRVGLKYYQVSAQPRDDGIDISWKTPGTVFGAVFHIMREDMSDGETEEEIAAVVEPEQYDENKRYYTYSDNKTVASHEYRYRIVGKFDYELSDHTIKHFEVASGQIVETAPIPVGSDIVSSLLPNPTGGETMFTVNVPKSYHDPTGGERSSRGGGMLGAAGLVEIQTPVDIGVYNVKGELVSTLFNRKCFGGLMTMSWNGKTKYGEPVSPGVYFLRVKAGGNMAVRKIIVIR